MQTRKYYLNNDTILTAIEPNTLSQTVGFLYSAI